jgi:hypothetical protein
MTSSTFGVLGRELAELAVQRDLILPDRRVHRAPPACPRCVAEAVREHDIGSDSLVGAVQVGVLLDQDVHRLVAILVGPLPALGRGAQKCREHIALRLQRFRGRVVRQRVELDPGVPERHVDPLGTQHLQRRGVGEPAGHGIDLAGHQRRHVGTDRHDRHGLLVDLVLGEQRLEQDDAGGLDADLLADHVLRAADRLLLQREEAVRMFLHADREALDRQPLGHRQHQRGTRRHLAQLEAAGGHHRDPVDAGTARLDVEVDAFLLEVALVLGHHLADLVTADQPAELHVDLGLAGCAGADRQQASAGQHAARRRRGPEQSATLLIQDILHRIPPGRWRDDSLDSRAIRQGSFAPLKVHRPPRANAR